MTSYMQIAKLDYALGGAMVLCGSQLPPLFNMVDMTESEAQATATYYGSDMRWFVWSGADDEIFPGAQTVDIFEGMLGALGVSETLIVSES